jgi:GT2 family glycosyltransferase
MDNFSKVLATIQIVGWNSAATLPAALKALNKLPVGFLKLRYIDNASRDESVKLVRELAPQAEVIALRENLGFTGAHNLGLERCDTPFVFTHDPDLEIELTGFLKLLEIMKSDTKIGSLQGKLWRSGNSGANNVIDSAGIVMSRAMNGLERGAGEIDRGQYDEPSLVAATTGAASWYRMEALRKVAGKKNEFFDKDFFAYKDDVDLGWRLRRAGWDVRYEPILAGWHKRSLGKRGKFLWEKNWWESYQRLRNPRTRYSLRNWIWMLVKNMNLKDVVKGGIFIALRKMIFLGVACVYWPLWKTWWETARGVPRMLNKRANL